MNMSTSSLLAPRRQMSTAASLLARTFAPIAAVRHLRYRWSVVVNLASAVVAATTIVVSPAAIAGAEEVAQPGSAAHVNESAVRFRAEQEEHLKVALSRAMTAAKKHSAPEHVRQALTVAQSSWSDYRDRTCEFASFIEGYANAPAKRDACMGELARRRIAEVNEIEKCISAEGFGGECALSQ